MNFGTKSLSTAVVCVGLIGGLSACASVSSDVGSKQRHTVPAHSKAATTKKAPAKPKYTVAQKNAIESAESYLDVGGFSKAGLVHQLVSGEKFKRSDANFAVSHVSVNWNKQAVIAAKQYLEVGGFSRDSLIEQLTSSYGDQFTQAQAEYAAKHVGL